MAGQAGHTLARLRTAQVRVRDAGIDPTTGLTSRDRFLAILQGLPSGTVVCLLGLPGCEREGTRIRTEERILTRFASQLRSVAGPGVEVARWSQERFVVAFPGGSHTRADEMVRRLRAGWDAESMPPFAVGGAVTGADQPASAALRAAEEALRDALHVIGSRPPARTSAGSVGTDPADAARDDRTGARA